MDKKSNEITAIPRLLKDLDCEGGIVSIDAIGCQKVIIEKIIEKKADYMIALKENQGELFQQINEYLEKENQGELFQQINEYLEKNKSQLPCFEQINRSGEP